MATLTEIRQAIALAIQPADLTIYSYRPAVINAPAAIIFPRSGIYHQAYEGDINYEFVVHCLSNVPDNETAQESLDGLLDLSSPTSLFVLLSADPTFGDVVQSSQVSGFDNYSETVLADGGTVYISAELTVEVFA